MYNKHWNIKTRVLVALFLLLSVGFILGSSVQAAEFRGDDNFVLKADEVINDDLFVSGDIVEINGTVKGDLFTTAEKVIINGVVEGSLFIAGQLLTVNGTINGSVYGIGYTLTLGPEATVARNSFFAGFGLETETGSTVGRSLYIAGYQAIINGHVDNNLEIGAAALELNGSVGGDVRGEIAEDDSEPPPQIWSFEGAIEPVNPGLRISNNAEIGGDVDIKRSKIDEDFGREESASSNPIFSAIGQFVALMIIGVLLLLYWPTLLWQSELKAKEYPLHSIGWGLVIVLLFVIFVPFSILFMILFSGLTSLITLGQLGGNVLWLGLTAIGFSVATFAFILSTITKIIIALLVGRIIISKTSPDMLTGKWGEFSALLLGALIYVILQLIPVVGWLVGALVVLAGLGSLYLLMKDKRSASVDGDDLDEPDEPSEFVEAVG